MPPRVLNDYRHSKVKPATMRLFAGQRRVRGQSAVHGRCGDQQDCH